MKKILIKKCIFCLMILSFVMSFMVFTPPVINPAVTKTYAATISKQRGFKVLFIGNSLTRSSGNTTMRHLQNLFDNAGLTLRYEIVAYGGECLETYANSNTSRGREARRMIKKRDWDVIVLQQETDHAIGRGNSLKTAVSTLTTYIKKNCQTARVILNCTWAYDKRKLGYSHNEQQRHMDANYRQAASYAGARVVYSGDAFDFYRTKSSNPTRLYMPDKNHATHAGYFINACCLFNEITRRSCNYVSYFGGQQRDQAILMKKCSVYARH